MQPFALLRSARGDQAPLGYSLQRDAARELGRRAHSRERDLEPSYTDTQRRHPHTPDTEREAKELFEKHMRRLEERFTDPSRRDTVAALGLAAKGFAPEAIGRTLRESSPDLDERKRGHVNDCVRLTARGRAGPSGLQGTRAIARAGRAGALTNPRGAHLEGQVRARIARNSEKF